MADTPPPRLRVSRSGLYDSHQNFPSEFLRDSVQLQETSAPFADQQSDDYSLWKKQTSDQEEDDARHRSSSSGSNSATPGPSRTAGAASASQPHGAEDTHSGRLRALMKRLDTPPSAAARPSPPPQPRSEAESDLPDSDEDHMRSYGNSIRDVFRRARKEPLDEDDVATPRQQQNTSRIPLSGNRTIRQRRLSLESTSGPREASRQKSLSDEETNKSRAADDSGVPAFRRSTSKSFEALRAQLENADLNNFVPSSGTERSADPSLPPSPRVENLNDSVVDFPSYAEESVPPAPKSILLNRDESPLPTVRPRTMSAGSVAKSRSSFLSKRGRPVSSLDREYGEISFASGEVDSSTPIKTKAERQQELEKSWGRASPASRRNSYLEDRSASPGLHLKRVNSRDESHGAVRSQSPMEVWEREREKNWNSPRPKPIGSRPEPVAMERRTSQDSMGNGARSRTSSVSSMSSRERSHPSPSPSPSPSVPSRTRTTSSPTAADVSRERERSWNKPATPVASHIRTTSMPGLDAAVLALRASPSPQLNRSHSLGNGHSKDKNGRQSAIPRARGGAVVYQPTTPSSSLLRRSSLINPVQEETEPESRAFQSDFSEAPERSTSMPAPKGSSYVPKSETPPRSTTPISTVADQSTRPEDVSVESTSGSPQMSRMERDTSRLQKAMAGSTHSPPPQSTTPVSSPPRPSNDAQASTTPQSSPQRPVDTRPEEIVTPSKRGFHQYPTEFSTPSPPKGGLPALPSPSSDEDELDGSLGRVKEPVRGVVVPLSRFGNSNRSYLAKTPKFPGAWATPGTGTPPFDDREHPHPKGEAAAALALKAEDSTQSESDVQSTPVIRSQELVSEATTSNDCVVSAREIPARSAGTPPIDHDQAASLSHPTPKTPAPPGQWLNTPYQRKSILKVRFDSPTLSSQAKQTSRPTTPDAVVESAHGILEALAGIGSDDEFGSGGTRGSKASPRKDPDSARKRPRMNMVDSYGRELLFASDGTPIKRLDERARIDSFDSQMSMENVSTVSSVAGGAALSASSAVEQHVSTPRRRPKMRMVDSFGDEVLKDESPEAASNQNGGLRSLNTSVLRDAVVLNSPLDTRGGSNGYDSDDTNYDPKTRIVRIRHAIDGIRGSLTGSDSVDDGLDSEFGWAKLNETAEEGTTKRLAIKREIEALGPPPLPRNGSFIEVQSRSGGFMMQIPRLVRKWPWMRYIVYAVGFTLLFQLLFLYAEYRAEQLFVTTYYDLNFAGYHDTGDLHAPTVSKWLMLGHEVYPVYVVKAWIADALYSSFGFSTFGEHGFRPNFVPT